MIIKQLKTGDRFAQVQAGKTIRFDVLAVSQHGRQVEIAFSSPLGHASARYPANAVLTDCRVL